MLMTLKAKQKIMAAWKWAAVRWRVTLHFHTAASLHRAHKSWWKCSRNRLFKYKIIQRKRFMIWAHKDEEWSKEDDAQVCSLKAYQI